MDKFLEKWRTDKKYRAKIKLLLYVVFIIGVTIYAIALNSNNDLIEIPDNTTDNYQNTDTNEIIFIPEKYNYEINIDINDENYKYSGEKTTNQTTIIKETNNLVTNYLLKDNEYYVMDNNLYIKTTRENVYDVVNYNYLNLDTINTYLNKAIKDNNQYLVYLKDIILGNDTDEYFIILINDNVINVDYTPLMKQFDSSIEKYKINIKITEIE